MSEELQLLNDNELDAALASSPSPYRITPDYLESVIRKQEFIENKGTGLTVCVMTTLNGFSLVGMSACADITNYNRDIGRTIARKNAFDQLWALEGYLLKQRMADVLSRRGKNPPVREGTFDKSEYPGIDLPSPVPPPFFLASFKDPTALREYKGGVFAGDDYFTDMKRCIVWSPDRGHVSCFAFDISSNIGSISESFRVEDQDAVVEALYAYSFKLADEVDDTPVPG